MKNPSSKGKYGSNDSGHQTKQPIRPVTSRPGKQGKSGPVVTGPQKTFGK